MCKVMRPHIGKELRHLPFLEKLLKDKFGILKQRPTLFTVTSINFMSKILSVYV